MKTKKAIASITVTLMLLLVSIVAYTAVSSWYSDLSSEITAKKNQQIGNIHGDFEILALKKEGTNYYLFIKNNKPGYIILNSARVNNNICTTPSSNVILGKQINKIRVDCPSYDTNNEIVLSSKGEMIQGRAKLN